MKSAHILSHWWASSGKQSRGRQSGKATQVTQKKEVKTKVFTSRGGVMHDSLLEAQQSYPARQNRSLTHVLPISNALGDSPSKGSSLLRF